jgi:hypothetical protein
LVFTNIKNKDNIYSNKLKLNNTTMGCGCKGNQPAQPPVQQPQTTNEAVANVVKKTVEKYYQQVKK